MKFNVVVMQEVEVELDESKFTPEFMQEFRANLYSFDSMEDHACHVAQLAARNIIGESSFIEGYGLAQEMGLKFNVTHTEAQID